MKLIQSSFIGKFAITTIGTCVLGCVLLFSACSSSLRLHESSTDLKIHTYTRAFINIHYVETGKKTLLIDCGNVDDSAKIETYFKKKDLDLSKVDYLIITHGHADHAGNAQYFKEKYGMKIIVGAAEQQIIADHGDDPDICPRGFNGWLISKTLGGRFYRPFEPDIVVEDTYDLSQLGIDGKIVTTPGHTPGSITTFIKNKAFTGDLITAKPFNKGKPSYHTFMCDLEDNLKDIQQIANEPGIEEWYLGHLGPLQVIDVKKFVQKEKRRK